MLFGYVPQPYPTVLPGAGVTIGALKAHGTQNAGYLAIGPSLSYGTQSHAKSNQINQLFGDVGNSSTWWGQVYDPDWVDHPIYDIGV